MKTEQRQYPRCSTPEAEIRIFSPGTNIVGQLANIGQKGLAFRYTPHPHDKPDFKVIDIFGITPERWRLPEVACRRTYDISVLAENQSLTGYETRLCGLQFIRLSSEQKEKLAIVLETCCT